MHLCAYMQPPKVCQRFILKPETLHIVCMRSIPGVVEESNLAMVSSDSVTGSTESQHKPSEVGKLATTDLGQLAVEVTRPASTGSDVTAATIKLITRNTIYYPVCAWYIIFHRDWV